MIPSTCTTHYAYPMTLLKLGEQVFRPMQCTILITSRFLYLFSKNKAKKQNKKTHRWSNKQTNKQTNKHTKTNKNNTKHTNKQTPSKQNKSKIKCQKEENVCLVSYNRIGEAYKGCTIDSDLNKMFYNLENSFSRIKENINIILKIKLWLRFVLLTFFFLIIF